jgi:hypothetical protein
MFKITIKNENDLSQALMQMASLSSLIKENIYDVEIKLHKEKRSLNANAYFHLLVGKIAEKLKIGNDECKTQMNLEYGSALRIDDDTLFAFKVPKGAEVKSVVKYPKWVKETNENGKQFDVYMAYKETHLLNTEEMARLIDGVVYEAKQLGIDTRTPEEIAQLKSLWEMER